jgi:hypothetical protein
MNILSRPEWDLRKFLKILLLAQLEKVHGMKAQQTNPVILRKMGLEALCKSLGPLGMVRFLQQYEVGTGDYTKERDFWLKDINIESIAIELRNRRKRKAR